MSVTSDELRQYALMTANQTKIDAEANEELVQKAYERVKSFEGVNCPICWVKAGSKFPLKIDAHADNENVYRCQNCGFSSVLPRPLPT